MSEPMSNIAVTAGLIANLAGYAKVSRATRLVRGSSEVSAWYESQRLCSRPSVGGKCIKRPHNPPCYGTACGSDCCGSDETCQNNVCVSNNSPQCTSGPVTCENTSQTCGDGTAACLCLQSVSHGLKCTIFALDTPCGVCSTDEDCGPGAYCVTTLADCGCESFCTYPDGEAQCPASVKRDLTL